MGGGLREPISCQELQTALTEAVHKGSTSPAEKKDCVYQHTATAAGYAASVQSTRLIDRQYEADVQSVICFHPYTPHLNQRENLVQPIP